MLHCATLLFYLNQQIHPPMHSFIATILNMLSMTNSKIRVIIVHFLVLWSHTRKKQHTCLWLPFVCEATEDCRLLLYHTHAYTHTRARARYMAIWSQDIYPEVNTVGITHYSTIAPFLYLCPCLRWPCVILPDIMV